MLDEEASPLLLSGRSTDPNDNDFGNDLLTINDSGVTFVQPTLAVDSNGLCCEDQFSDRGGDKENEQPFIDISASHQALDTWISYEDQDRFSFGEDTRHGEFQPLSFDSNHSFPSQRCNANQVPVYPEPLGNNTPSFLASQRYLSHEQPTGEGSIDRTSKLAEHFPSRSSSPENSLAISAALITNTHSAERSHIENFPSHTNSHNRTPDSTSALLMNTNFAGHSLTDFLTWRNRSVNLDLSIPANPPTDDINSDSPPQTHVPPDTMFDHNTLRLPSPWLLPSTAHRYLASVNLIQKRSIVRSFGLRECAVEIVERETIDGVDLVLDPYTAVVFVSLMALPSQCEALTSMLGEQSWRYSRLLVIFEAFPSSMANKTSQGPKRLIPNAYTPPALKAIKKLRRDLGIAEAFKTKSTQTSVHFAFANSVDEAAMFTRCFGDCAEASDNTGGVIWGTRQWLDAEVQEDEQYLATVDGMNAFAALIILCQKPLHDFLDMAPETRMIEFGHLVGRERLILFNEVLEHRYQAIQSHIPSSP